jgi:fatty-acyl-CoA synthase
MKIRKIEPATAFSLYPLLVKQILDYSTVLAPEHSIVYREKARYDYVELNRRIRKLANVFSHMGIEGGETIAVMDYDSHRYLENYFAVPMTGNVLHTVNWRLAPEQILFTIRHAEDRVLIVHADFMPLVEKFADKMPSVKEIIVIAESSFTGSPALPLYGEYEKLLDEAEDIYDFPDFDEEAVATTFYTTGTTGDPKGVYFTHRQLVLHTLNIAVSFGFIAGAACRLSSDDVYMPLTPMFHVHAWGFPYLATMFSMNQVYPGKYTPAGIAGLLRKERPTLSHGVPTVLQMVLGCPEASDIDLSGWKVITGGSALPKGLARAALQRGVDVMTGYGMSETCPIIALSQIHKKDADRDLDWQVEARTRTGIRVPLVQQKIFSPKGGEIRADDQDAGELLLRAPWLTHGYVGEPEKGKLLWEGGYMHTGDLASMDAKGSLKIADRIKDLIKTGGEWISSIAMENLISQHESVAESAVVAIPDPKWGERPLALVVAREGTRLSEEILREYLSGFVEKGMISKWAVPDRILITETIPKTSVGKIDKKRIRAENQSNP